MGNGNGQVLVSIKIFKKVPNSLKGYKLNKLMMLLNNLIPFRYCGVSTNFHIIIQSIINFNVSFIKHIEHVVPII